MIEKYFTGTPSRLEGIGLDEIAKEVELRHLPAFKADASDLCSYESGSVYQWRSGGERHMFNPQTVLHCSRPAAKTITLCSNAFPAN